MDENIVVVKLDRWDVGYADRPLNIYCKAHAKLDHSWWKYEPVIIENDFRTRGYNVHFKRVAPPLNGYENLY